MTILSINWNPSIGIDLGFFVIRYYSLMFVIAFFIGFYLMKKIFINDNISLEKLDKIFVYAFVGILLGARIGHFLFYDPMFLLSNPLEVLLPIKFSPKLQFVGFSGLASHGAAIGAIISLFIYQRKVLKKPFLYILDRVVVVSMLGGAFVRIGNFMNSEIVGKVTNSDFGVKFIQNDMSKMEAMRITNAKTSEQAYDLIINNDSLKHILDNIPNRHPAQLYEAAAYILIFLVLYYFYWKTPKRNHRGFLFGMYFTLVWTARFFIEFLKEAQVDMRDEWALNTGQLLSIPMVLMGLYFMFTSSKRQEKQV
ncbi:MAG: prolipoprotein diacylglyceryl transferase [Flavobacteriaceae bacterium]|nr:prolipoprotein diacylglyceryl transferase [Flavobacteriaceae bacterium]